MFNHISKFLFFSILLFGLASCEPQQDGAIDLGLPPAEATFTVESTGEVNTYALRNTTPGAFLFQWDLGDGRTETGETVEVKYQNMGTYEVKLTAFNKAGSGSGSQTIVVDEDAPVDCETSAVLKFLSDCGSKTWRLSPEAGALFVGPGDGSVWWTSPEEEVDTRPCMFNDEWTFTPDGTMVYDSKGDIWGEDYMGFNFECVPTTDLGPAVADWGDGTHSFVVIEGDGTPDRLQVTGSGAFIALPKATNSGEVSTPVSSTTYDIVLMEDNAGQDYLTIAVNYGPGVWTFKLASF